MAAVVVLHPLLRKLYDALTALKVTEQSREDVKGDARMHQRIRYDLLFAVCFLLVLHGSSALKVFVILYLNFQVASRLPRRAVPPATWIFNIAVLFANELCHGYPYQDIARFISVRPLNGDHTSSQNWGTWLDSYGGLIPRWEILFNITVLRLISFNLDYYWSLDRRAVSPVEVSSNQRDVNSLLTDKQKKQLTPETLTERDRVDQPPAPATFCFSNYLAYVLYSPLYLAGPILTFNDYISQLRYPSPSITRTRTALYAVRFVLCLLSMELVLHYIYAVAISKSNPNWSHYTPFQLSMLGYFNLHIIWLKLLLPWRFFRLWSLLDGIDPPENMVRCMSDNYSALAFWRGWHRSFNRWIVRYIFVPLGGTGRGISVPRSLFNLLAVFTFVALWHDISLRLLTWSWLIVLFMTPELLCSTVLFPAKAYKDRPETYRILCGIGAVGTILMMMAANLVGFAVGLDGLQGLIKGIVSGWEGWAFLATACAVLFTGVMVMFEIREHEKRKGISMKC